MPIFDGNLPYTNLHELNLDWIVKIVANVYNRIDNLDAEIEEQIVNLANQGVITVNSKLSLYDTVADMLSDTSPIVNNIAFTKGYYSANDGGSALYVLRNSIPSDVNDNMFIYLLSNNITAELITGDTINALQIGFNRTGSVDNSTKLFKFNDYDNKTFYFPQGDYLFNSPVTITRHITLLGQSETFLGIDRLNRTVFTFNLPANSTGLTLNANHCSIKNIMFYSTSYTSSADATLIDGTTNNWYTSTTAVSNVSGVEIASYNNEISDCTFRGFSANGLKIGLNNKGNNLYFVECYTGLRTRNDSIFDDLFFKLCERGIIHEGSLTTITNVRLDFIKTVCIILGTNSNSNIIKNVIADTVGERCIEFQNNCGDNYVECYGRVGYRYASVRSATYASNPQYSCMVYIIGGCVGNTIVTSATQRTVNGITAPYRTVVQSAPDHTVYKISGYKAITNNDEILYTRYGYTATDSVLEYAYSI